MRKILAITVIAAGLHIGAHAQGPADSAAFADAKWTVTMLGKGAEAHCAQMEIFDSKQSICVIKYPAAKYETRLLYSPGEDADITSRLAGDAGAEFAINASYFNVRTHYSTVFCSVGKKILYPGTNPPEAYRVNGIFGLKDKKGRKIVIEACDTSAYRDASGKLHSAIAAGPVLVIDGDIVVPEKAEMNLSSAQFYDKRHPRAVVGTDNDGWVYFVVIDGRSAGNADGTTIYETAWICRMLGMEDAINMDGGGSSCLWSDQEGVLNHPSDNKKFDHEGERIVPSIIAVF